MSDKFLICVASGQVWPIINAILFHQPTHLILLHTADAKRSLQPSIRLEAFATRNRLLEGGNIHRREIPSDDFNGVSRILKQVKTEFGLDASNAIVNLLNHPIKALESDIIHPSNLNLQH
jgi:hypothetical protein